MRKRIYIKNFSNHNIFELFESRIKKFTKDYKKISGLFR